MGIMVPMKRPFMLYLLRLRVLGAEFTHPSELQVTLFWAGIVGFLGGLSSFSFRLCIRAFQWFLTGSSGSLVEIAMHLPWWKRVLVPVTGGFLAGAVLYFGMRLTRGNRSTDYMEAISLRDGVIPTRASLIKCLSSLLTIASGGSIGREGSMVQLGAWLASVTGRWVRLSAPRLKLLVACGAAAGIAAAYNAPIAGALFVAEIILGSIAMESFGPLIFASVISTLTVRNLWGGNPIFEVPAFQMVSAWELISYLILGIVAGVAAPWFLRFLKGSEDMFSATGLPVYLRLTLGGLFLGALSFFAPQVWGNGYSVINSLLHTPWPWLELIIILGCKLLGTAATFGSGATGGVFTPTLFVGASLGCLFGQAINALVPGVTGSASAYALVGMACMLAGTTHAPLMAMLMLFEMTLDYDIMLPLMSGCIVASYVARSIEPRSIYSESLKRHQVPKPRISSMRVRDLMRCATPCVHETAPFTEVVQQFIASRRNNLFVVKTNNEFLGAISLHDVKSNLETAHLDGLLSAHEVTRTDVPWVVEDALLTDTLEKFRELNGERLPVVNNLTERRLVGALAKTDVLLTLSQGDLMAKELEKT